MSPTETYHAIKFTDSFDLGNGKRFAACSDYDGTVCMHAEVGMDEVELTGLTPDQAVSLATAILLAAAEARAKRDPEPLSLDLMVGREVKA